MGKRLPIASDGVGTSAGPGEPVLTDAVSASMRPVEAVIRELAQSDVPVLLLAERGAGKLATARRIHATSHRHEQPFLWLQCAGAKPEDLQALVEPAGTPRASTLYLEELADLSADSQLHLLNALSRTDGPAGDSGSRVRLICGSSHDLEIEVREGRLREDLYYRISVVCLRLPPLRQRKEDVPLLMQHFLRKYAKAFQREIPALSGETLRLFQAYSWPGNLRELEDASRVLVALGDEQVAMGGLRAMLREPETGGKAGEISLKKVSREASREAERVLILEALTRTRWNRRRAAEQLQISYKALLYKLKQIGGENMERSRSTETI